MSSNRPHPLNLSLTPVQALTRFAGLAPTELPLAPVEPAAQAAVERWAVPLGPYRLLVDPAAGCELSELVDIWPLPNTPAWISGVINLRGDLVPVFDLQALFSTQAQWPPRSSRLLFIVGTGESAGAVIADGLPHRQRLDAQLPAELPDNLPEPLAQRLYAVYRQQETYWLDCDLPGLLHDLGRRADTTSGELGV